jgi:hypothetical protein
VEGIDVEKRAAGDFTSEESARLRAEIDVMLVEIDSLRREMDVDQMAIERSQATTRRMLDELLAQLRAS